MDKGVGDRERRVRGRMKGEEEKVGKERKKKWGGAGEGRRSKEEWIGNSIK